MGIPFSCNGLALANHYPLVVLTGLGLVFLLDRLDLDPGDVLKALIFLGLGLTPYLYLFIQAARPELQYNFGKLSDFGMVLDHILRKYYANDYGGTAWDKLVLAFTLIKATVTNFLSLKAGAILLVCGAQGHFPLYHVELIRGVRPGK